MTIKIPHHVAIVMDGNGRWAQKRGLPRTTGHEAGEAALFDVVEGAIEFGVKEISAYAFSTENWRRSPEEVKFLMGFNRDVIRRRRDQMNEMGVRIRWVGRPKRLWSSVINELEEAEELTKKNKKLTLNMCVNYGGRAEIVDAAAGCESRAHPAPQPLPHSARLASRASYMAAGGKCPEYSFLQRSCRQSARRACGLRGCAQPQGPQRAAAKHAQLTLRRW